MRRVRARHALAALAAAALAAACSPPPAPLPPVPSPAEPAPVTTGAAPQGCQTPRAPMFPLPALAPEEPDLAIPTPPGWAYTGDHNDQHNRGTIFNKALKAHDFITNAGVTLDSVTVEDLVTDQATADDIAAAGNIPHDDRTPDGALKYQRLLLEHKVRTFDVDTTGTLCGYPSRTLVYSYEGRQTASLLVAGQDYTGSIWIATVNLQTADPADPTYQRDQQIIFDGFQFSLPE